MWDNLDSSLKSVYNIDPTLTNLLLWVTYDSSHPKNSQNTIVESNCGASIPDYAVTSLQWYQLGVGLIVKIDVSASSGTLGDRYNLVDYNIPSEEVPTLSEWGMIVFFILMVGSALWVMRRRTRNESV